MTFVSGAADRISCSSLKPSEGSSGRGGSPKSMVTTAGRWRLTWARALSRSAAGTGSYCSNAQVICVCRAGSSSMISKRPLLSLMVCASRAVAWLPVLPRRIPVERKDILSPRPGTGFAFRLQVPSDLLYVLRSLVGADAHAGALGGLERPEQPLAQEFLAHAAAGIADLDARARLVREYANRHHAPVLGRIERILEEMPDDALQALLVRERQHPARAFDGDMARVLRLGVEDAFGNEGEVDRQQVLLAAAASAQLEEQLVHPVGHIPDGGEHVILETRIVAVTFGILEEQRELGDEVLQVVDHEGGHLVEGVELFRLEQSFGRLHLGQKAADLARRGLEQVAHFPVDVYRGARRGENHEADQVILRNDRNDKPRRSEAPQPLGQLQVRVA